MRDRDGFRVWIRCIEMVCGVFVVRFSRDSRHLPRIYIVRSPFGIPSELVFEVSLQNRLQQNVGISLMESLTGSLALIIANVHVQGQANQDRESELPPP